ncbi:MAG TPA: hypothetical protein VGM78_07240, partial [Ilumatobacteraceae bacterium]
MDAISVDVGSFQEPNELEVRQSVMLATNRRAVVALVALLSLAVVACGEPHRVTSAESPATYGGPPVSSSPVPSPTSPDTSASLPNFTDSVPPSAAEPVTTDDSDVAPTVTVGIAHSETATTDDQHVPDATTVLADVVSVSDSMPPEA